MTEAISTDREETPDEYFARLNSIRYFELDKHSYEKSTSEEPLGKGVFGVVYSAVQLPERTPVALKCAYPSEYGTPGTMLANEVSITRSLGEFPWKLKVLDYRSSPDEFECAALERGGLSLKKYIEGPLRLELCQAVNVGLQMVMAIAELHQANVAHGDLNPGNFLLGPASDPANVKLIDFGQATQLEPKQWMFDEDSWYLKMVLIDLIGKSDPENSKSPVYSALLALTNRLRHLNRTMITSIEIPGCPAGATAAAP